MMKITFSSDILRVINNQMKKMTTDELIKEVENMECDLTMMEFAVKKKMGEEIEKRKQAIKKI